jgi:alcohol dehydrogenase (NADP+)
VCHSDVHQARDEWIGGFSANYPSMPGHEIAGIVTVIGGEVTAFAVGDRVGVGV